MFSYLAFSLCLCRVGLFHMFLRFDSSSKPKAWLGKIPFPFKFIGSQIFSKLWVEKGFVGYIAIYTYTLYCCKSAFLRTFAGAFFFSVDENPCVLLLLFVRCCWVVCVCCVWLLLCVVWTLLFRRLCWVRLFIRTMWEIG